MKSSTPTSQSMMGSATLLIAKLILTTFFYKDIFFVLTLLLLLASRTYDCTVRSVKLHNSYGACYTLPLVDVK